MGSDPVEPNDPIERRRGLSGGSGVHRRSVGFGGEKSARRSGDGVKLSLLLLRFLLCPCSSGFVQVDVVRLRLRLPDWLLSSEFDIDSPLARDLMLGISNWQRRTHARSSSLVENKVGR